MKEITINLYSFEELSEKAKEKALSDLSDINTDYPYWEFTYEDAENIGIKLTGFDLQRKSKCDGELITTIQKSIGKVLSEHGETCKTYQIALDYKKELERTTDEEMENLESAYLDEMLQEYHNILDREYDYLISEEAIIETINANDYTFEENGKLRNS